MGACLLSSSCFINNEGKLCNIQQVNSTFVSLKPLNRNLLFISWWYMAYIMCFKLENIFTHPWSEFSLRKVRFLGSGSGCQLVWLTSVSVVAGASFGCHYITLWIPRLGLSWKFWKVFNKIVIKVNLNLRSLWFLVQKVLLFHQSLVLCHTLTLSTSRIRSIDRYIVLLFHVP